MISQSILVTIILLLATEVNSEILPTIDCPTSWGNYNIPFPFGITYNFSVWDTSLNSRNLSYNPPKPILNSSQINGTSLCCGATSGKLFGNDSVSLRESFRSRGNKDNANYPRRSLKTNRSTLFFIASGLIVPVLGSLWIFWRRKQRKVVKLRQKLFKRNGGLILENMLSRQRTLQVFTAEDLKRATNNYDEDRIIRVEQYFRNTCYEGLLPDGENQQVTIRKCDALDTSDDVEVFISKLVTLSQIHHSNIVKLIGCCLETQNPLLVYESINAKTLHDYIHDDYRESSLTWDIRLKIATETAGALAYLHSFAAVPIIHGNLSSSTIMLNHDYTVKLHDFALTCSDISDFRFYACTHGYLDPEYSFSGQLTVKSDVYSFGVILTELLTGKMAISSEIPNGEEHLPKYFVSLPIGDNLLRILDHRLVTEGKIEQLIQVTKLAQRCLSNSSQQRPTMKEVIAALRLRTSSDSGSYSYTGLANTTQLAGSQPVLTHMSPQSGQVGRIRSTQLDQVGRVHFT